MVKTFVYVSFRSLFPAIISSEILNNAVCLYKGCIKPTGFIRLDGVTLDEKISNTLLPNLH